MHRFLLVVNTNRMERVVLLCVRRVRANCVFGLLSSKAIFEATMRNNAEYADARQHPLIEQSGHDI